MTVTVTCAVSAAGAVFAIIVLRQHGQARGRQLHLLKVLHHASRKRGLACLASLFLNPFMAFAQ